MLLLVFHLKIENLKADNSVWKLQLYYLINWMSHTSSLQKSDSPWMTVSGLNETKVLSVMPGLGVGALLVTWVTSLFQSRDPGSSFGMKIISVLKLRLWQQLPNSGLHNGEKKTFFRALFIYILKHPFLYEKNCAPNTIAYTNLISQLWREPRVTSSRINE